MIWVQIPLEMHFFLLYMYSNETFSINLPAAHYNTNHVDRGTKMKAVMRMLKTKQNKTINNGDKAVHTQSRIF